MLEYKPYFYYSKFDASKESLDKILAFSYESALEHFSTRKQLRPEIFLNLYEIVNSYEETESK
jgi:hypothetical protein